MNGSTTDLREVMLDFLIAAALNVIFLVLAALLLWPLGKILLPLRLAQAYGVFWIVTLITVILVSKIQGWLRIDTDTNFDAYVIINFVHSLVLLAGWSAYAALTVHSFAMAAPLWITMILYVVGFLSSYMAFTIISAFFTGSIYKLLNLIFAQSSFVLFALWPASGRFLYGWFLDRF